MTNHKCIVSLLKCTYILYIGDVKYHVNDIISVKR